MAALRLAPWIALVGAEVQSIVCRALASSRLIAHLLQLALCAQMEGPNLSFPAFRGPNRWEGQRSGDVFFPTSPAGRPLLFPLEVLAVSAAVPVSI